MVRPAISRSAFRGSRVEPNRAGMMAIALMLNKERHEKPVIIAGKNRVTGRLGFTSSTEVNH